MKIRIQDNSIRFRITLKELDELNRVGRIEAISEIYSPDGTAREGRFVYALGTLAGKVPSRCAIEPGGITLYLNGSDLATLNNPSEEGAYLRRETRLPSGEPHRFIAFVEKDRPATRCNKPERWIYEYATDGSPASTRPITRNGS